MITAALGLMAVSGGSGTLLLYEDHQAIGSMNGINAESYMLDPEQPAKERLP